MRRNGGGRKESGRAKDGTDSLAHDPARDAIDERLLLNLAYLEAKRAPAIVFRMLEAATGAACDELAWGAEVQGQQFAEAAEPSPQWHEGSGTDRGEPWSAGP